RPEFIPFHPPYLCATTPFDNDNEGFWDYPARAGWQIHRSDRKCHSGPCPPGTCVVSADQMDYGLQVPSTSRLDGEPSSVSEKVAFLQAWLFFGAMVEVCSLCRLELDSEKIPVSEGFVDMKKLNGLPQKLFVASRENGQAGKQTLRRKLYAIAREIQLMITRVGFEDEHEYTFSECEVLLSIYVFLRVVLLAFLCH
ncbi:hypothetical protein K435DRAFT_618326, partial [Dendrothele bispora CBS 962.96]